MTADIELLPLAPSSVAAFTEALRGPRGSLDAWLEVNNEAEVRAHVEAYAEQAIDSLRAEISRLRLLCQSVHDRLLRGDDDAELLAMLEEGWAALQERGE